MMLFASTEKEMRDCSARAEALLPNSLIRLDRERKLRIVRLLFNQSSVMKGGIS